MRDSYIVMHPGLGGQVDDTEKATWKSSSAFALPGALTKVKPCISQGQPAFLVSPQQPLRRSNPTTLNLLSSNLLLKWKPTACSPVTSSVYRYLTAVKI